jgi:FtsP/CotA-like multicopper oxidase with cupredoxin domain
LNEPNPTQTRGTIPGATIEAKVGDDVVVHFRNMDLRTQVPDRERLHSLHVHGLAHAPMHDGLFPYSMPDPEQGNKRGDRVAPQESFDYKFTVPHLSTAGAWVYHDGSAASQASIGLGALGAVIVRAGGEGKPQTPSQPLHSDTDTAISFANAPRPASESQHLFVVHELAGIGLCLNGRQLAGNTPTVLTRLNTRAKFRVVNMTARAQSFHLHGHRWRRGDDWTDSETIPAGGGVTFEILEGTAENGGGNGEWAITIPSAAGLAGSLLVTEGGKITLATGAGG